MVTYDLDISLIHYRYDKAEGSLINGLVLTERPRRETIQSTRKVEDGLRNLILRKSLAMRKTRTCHPKMNPRCLSNALVVCPNP
jgi:hypothetical protein